MSCAPITHSTTVQVSRDIAKQSGCHAATLAASVIRAPSLNYFHNVPRCVSLPQENRSQRKRGEESPRTVD